MERVILHCDFNNFYASVECLDHPELRGKPVAVAGDAEARHGIVLAKNECAKAYGIKTGEVLWAAKRKCPDILFVPAHYARYLDVSRQARGLYSEYTNQVESYGLDECWLDVTGSAALFGGGKTIADEIRSRIKSELGVTASIGVSFNKVFAKLGSDLQKPDATTVIPRDRYRAIVWPLPAEDLLFVGPATTKKLHLYGIHTIGDIARADPRFLEGLLGKNGLLLWTFANGMDVSPVVTTETVPTIKSIGNSTTTPRDLLTEDDVKITLYTLCESVSARMREQGFICNTVQLTIRDNDLYSFSRQRKLSIPCRTADALFESAYYLYQKHHSIGKPIRSLGVRACGLEQPQVEQLSLLPEIAAIQRRERLETAIDAIRQKYGHFSVQRSIMLTDMQLSALDPQADHVIHPETFFK